MVSLLFRKLRKGMYKILLQRLAVDTMVNRQELLLESQIRESYRFFLFRKLDRGVLKCVASRR